MKIENCKIENYCCYAFVLGREQKIALFELESVLRRFGVCFDILSLHNNIVIIKTNAGFSDQISVIGLMQLLGGTVKIFEIMQNAKCKMQNYGMESLLLDKLSENQTGGTLNFAISDYSGFYKEKELKQIGIEIKKEARKKRPVRFVGGSGVELSSATSFHKIFKTGGEEFGIFDANSKFKIQNLKFNLNSKLPEGSAHGGKIENYTIGRLIATTNPDEWSERDYGKPAEDKFSGMMPPKLARMMVNIALGQGISNNQYPITNEIPNSKIIECHSERSDNRVEESHYSSFLIPNSSQKPLVFDPFCGSGNILMEAKMLGCEIVGSDISEKAVEDTRANLVWLCQNSKFKIQNSKFNENSKLPEGSASGGKIENSIFVADATSYNFANKLQAKKLKSCVIVTEPYLGKPKKIKDKKSKIKNEIDELKKLYLGFFSNLAIQRFNNAIKTICFVFPIIETLDAGEVSLYSECVDELRQMGYNTGCTLRYGRGYQVVKREIVLLELDNQRIEEPKNDVGNIL